MKELIINSRKFNRDRLAAKARSKDISVGDTVMLLADDRIKFASRWDPHRIVNTKYAKTLTIVSQLTHTEKKLYGEKVRLVDPHVNWDPSEVGMKRNQLNQLKRITDVLPPNRADHDTLFGSSTDIPVTGKVRDIRQIRGIKSRRNGKGHCHVSTRESSEILKNYSCGKCKGC